VTFVKRKIELAITLTGAAKFKGTSANTLTLADLRMQTKVIKAGGATKGQLTASIYGMTLSQMNQLSTLGMKIQSVPINTVTIGSAESIATAKPTSYKGGVDVNVVLAGLAKQMNLVYESNVEPILLSNPYFSGSAWNQMRACANAAGISCTIDDGILAAWPRNGARKSDPVEVNTKTGMVGYPAYTSQGIQVRTLFNPALKFGGKVKVTSTLEPATGIWSIFTLDHSLDCLMPNGQWFSTLGCYNPGVPVVTK
jgi:hypothetical protein